MLTSTAPSGDDPDVGLAVVAVDDDGLAGLVLQLQAVVVVQDLDVEPGHRRLDAVELGSEVDVALVSQGGTRRERERERDRHTGDKAAAHPASFSVAGRPRPTAAAGLARDRCGRRALGERGGDEQTGAQQGATRGRGAGGARRRAGRGSARRARVASRSITDSPGKRPTSSGRTSARNGSAASGPASWTIGISASSTAAGGEQRNAADSVPTGHGKERKDPVAFPRRSPPVARGASS